MYFHPRTFLFLHQEELNRTMRQRALERQLVAAGDDASTGGPPSDGDAVSGRLVLSPRALLGVVGRVLRPRRAGA